MIRNPCFALVVAALVTTGQAARAQSSAAPPEAGLVDTLRFIADLTLIDGHCRDAAVNFGAGFRFAAEHGVSVVDLMPSGALRPMFELVMRQRSAALDRDMLCQEVALDYERSLPEAVTEVPHTRARDR